MGVVPIICQIGCGISPSSLQPHAPKNSVNATPAEPNTRLTSFQKAIQGNLDQQIASKIRYIDAYYDGGEPPKDIGVCTDVVVRSYHAAGVDLQNELFADEKQNPTAYKSPNPDRNIDHRRCTRLIVFFQRHSKSLSQSADTHDWQPGDIVFYDTGNVGKIDHVAVLSAVKGHSGNYQIVQAWPRMLVHQTDQLFAHKIVGHFRWNRAATSH